MRHIRYSMKWQIEMLSCGTPWLMDVHRLVRSMRHGRCLGELRKEGIQPSGFMFTGVLSVFALVGDLNKGSVVHGLVIKTGFDSYVPFCIALIGV
ncbi:hypothetical protein M5689_009102 [Euphorbia peplus]|nr:hypothetical protein M5689_009102 [Euphorbia peplus]